MKYLLTIDDREHTLEVTQGKTFACRFDGAPFDAEAVEIASGTYSLLLAGKSYPARVALSPEHSGPDSAKSHRCSVQVDGASYSIAVHDPRRWSRGRGALAPEGRQQITAPMPGKIVRVLVQLGQRVEAGQGLIVVEAMKMQNEIKCQSAGMVEKLLVLEGQAVTAGQTLLIIE